jgi:hypothetical protein
MNRADTINSLLKELDSLNLDLLAHFQVTPEEWLRDKAAKLRRVKASLEALFLKDSIWIADEPGEVATKEALIDEVVSLKVKLNSLLESWEQVQTESQELKRAINVLVSDKAALQRQLDDLKVKDGEASPNSSNSGKSSSHDLFPPKKDQEEDPDEKLLSKKAPGPKPGHPAYQYQKFSLEDPTIKVVDLNHTPPFCPCCGEQLDWEEVSIKRRDHLDVTRHASSIEIERVVFRFKVFRCLKCGHIHSEPLPKDIAHKPLLGSGAVSLIVKDLTLNNFSTRLVKDDLLHDYNIDISLGLINNSAWRATKALLAAFCELFDSVKDQDRVWADETPFRDRGLRRYAWAFTTKSFTVFTVGDRSIDTVYLVLGKTFIGILTSDKYVVYDSYIGDPEVKAIAQKCLEHLKRELKRCADHADPEIRTFGEGGVKRIQAIYKKWHEFKGFGENTSLEAKSVHGELVKLSEELNEYLINGPQKGKAKALSARMKKSGQEYFTFLFYDDVDPDNNRAERAIRSMVIKRKIRLSAQGLRGRLEWSVFETVKATCKLNGIHFGDFVKQSIESVENNQLPPSLKNKGEVVPQKYVDAARAMETALEKEIKEEKAQKEALKAKALEKKKSAEATIAQPEGSEVPIKAQPEGSEVPIKAQPEGSKKSKIAKVVSSEEAKLHKYNTYKMMTKMQPKESKEVIYNLVMSKITSDSKNKCIHNKSPS